MSSYSWSQATLCVSTNCPAESSLAYKCDLFANSTSLPTGETELLVWTPNSFALFLLQLIMWSPTLSPPSSLLLLPRQSQASFSFCAKFSFITCHESAETFAAFALLQGAPCPSNIWLIFSPPVWNMVFCKYLPSAYLPTAAMLSASCSLQEKHVLVPALAKRKHLAACTELLCSLAWNCPQTLHFLTMSLGFLGTSQAPGPPGCLHILLWLVYCSPAVRVLVVRQFHSGSSFSGNTSQT